MRLRRPLLLTLAATLLLAPATAASADHPRALDMTFPVANPDQGVHYSDTYHAPRSDGAHAATDIMAPKHRPVHAAVGGTISWAPYPEPSYGWMLSIDGDDGREYHYVHLNNDTPGTDDGVGGVDRAYAPKIAEAARAKGDSLLSSDGVTVERGELIGWVGDSGNAEWTGSHIHFEVVGERGHARNPYESLRAAQERGDIGGQDAPDEQPADEPATSQAPADTGSWNDVNPNSVHLEAIEALTDDEVVDGCGGGGYCPHDELLRGTLATYLARALELPEPTRELDYDDVDADHPDAEDIARVSEAGIMVGRNDDTFAADEPLKRSQLATVLMRGYDLPEAEGATPFNDVEDNAHAESIAAAFEAGLTEGCTEQRYCTALPVERDQIASFLHRAEQDRG